MANVHFFCFVIPQIIISIGILSAIVTSQSDPTVVGCSYLVFDVLSVRNLRHHPLYDTTAELLTTASSLRFAANINSIYVPYSKDSKRMRKNTRGPWSTLLIWDTFPSNKQARAKVMIIQAGWLKVAIFSRTSDISSLNEQNYKLT